MAIYKMIPMIKTHFRMNEKLWKYQGNAAWKTSIFPDSKRGAYILPIKSDVRRNEDLVADQTIKFAIEILV